MNRSISFLMILLFLSVVHAGGQTIFVDASRGKDGAAGTITDPVASLENAVVLARSFSGNEPVTIRLYPGLYLLRQQAELKTGKLADDTMRYSIEAVVMPDDPDWKPASMPVIQSVSADNSSTQFIHAVGFLAAKHNVRLRGLKFVGSANPSVRYYYPVTRENENLSGLEISQCYFIGEKNSAPIQGAIFARRRDPRGPLHFLWMQECIALV